jgi:hypothetical protein
MEAVCFSRTVPTYQITHKNFCYGVQYSLYYLAGLNDKDTLLINKNHLYRILQCKRNEISIPQVT